MKLLQIEENGGVSLDLESYQLVETKEKASGRNKITREWRSKRSFPGFPIQQKPKEKKKKKKKNQNPCVLQSPLSCPTSPVKVVHFSNAVADDTKAILEDSISFLTTAKLENYKLGPEHKSQLIFH